MPLVPADNRHPSPRHGMECMNHTFRESTTPATSPKNHGALEMIAREHGLGSRLSVGTMGLARVRQRELVGDCGNLFSSIFRRFHGGTCTACTASLFAEGTSGNPAEARSPPTPRPTFPIGDHPFNARRRIAACQLTTPWLPCHDCQEPHCRRP